MIKMAMILEHITRNSRISEKIKHSERGVDKYKLSLPVNEN